MLKRLRTRSPRMVMLEVLLVVLILVVFWGFRGTGFRSENRAIIPEGRTGDSIADGGPVTLPQPPAPTLATGDNNLVEQQNNVPQLICTELIVNGDFEEVGGWTMPMTDRPPAYTGERRFSGERSLKLGLDAEDENMSSDSTASQWIDLPAGAGQILLRAQIWQTSSGDNADTQYLLVTGDERTITVFQETVDSGEWQTLGYNLTPLRGQRVRILFGAYNNGTGGQAAMYIDNVEIEQCDARQVSVTPGPTTTPGPRATPTTMPNYAPVAEMRSPDFGVNAFLWRRPEIADRDLQLIDEANFHWVRQSFAWEDLEVAPGEFDWENADLVVQQVNEHGLNLVARLGMAPALTEFWAGRPPQNLDEFVDFVEALVRRYNCTPQAVGCIQAYQIWNEPNLAREWGGNPPNPTGYAELLADAYTVIKAANPNAIVISAGMAPTGSDNALSMFDETFYRQLYEAMDGSSAGYFDLLGVLAAGFAAPPELDPAEAAADPQYGGQRFFAFRHVEDIRRIMVEFGDSETRVAILAFGWTSDAYTPDTLWFGAGAGIDEFVKADYLVRAYQYAAEHWQPWIALMNVFTMPNLDWLKDGNPYDERQYWWAISEPSEIDELRLRPAYVALCRYLNELDDKPCMYAPEE